MIHTNSTRNAIFSRPCSKAHLLLRAHWTSAMWIGWIKFCLNHDMDFTSRKVWIYIFISQFFSLFQLFLAQKWQEAPRKENVRDAECQAFMLLSADLTSLFLGLSRDSYFQDELWGLQIELDWTDHVASSRGMAQGVLLWFSRSRGELELLTLRSYRQDLLCFRKNKQTNSFNSMGRDPRWL